MSTTPTLNYGWLLPVPGTEVDLWGQIVNDAFVEIDVDVFAVQGIAIAAQSTANSAQTTANAALPKAGGTMTGPVVAAPAVAGDAGVKLGVGVNPTAPLNGDIWATDAGIFGRAYGATLDLGAASSEGGVTGDWRFDTSTIMADPGNGDIRLNNALWGSVTQIAIDEISSTGNDASSVLAMLAVGDEVYIQVAGNATIFFSGTINAPPVDNGVWWMLPVTRTGSSIAVPGSTAPLKVRIKHPSNPVSITSSQISDSTAAGRTILTAADAAAQRTALDVDQKGVTAPNNQTGTVYTPVLTDRSKMIMCNNASPFTLTIPLNATAAFPVGTRIDVVQWGAGQVTVVPEGAVALVSSGNKRKTTGQYSGVTIWKQATDTWAIFGDIAA